MMNINTNNQDEQIVNEIWQSYLTIANENHERYKKGVITESQYILAQAEYAKQTINELGQFMFDLISKQSS